MATTYNSTDIQRWYKAILFRDPSPPESSAHLLALNSAKTTADKLISGILSSPEYENTVSPVLLIYRGILERMPDQQGFNYWSTKLFLGENIFNATLDVSNSAEFKHHFGSSANAPLSATFIKTLYQQVLGREPDVNGLKFWTQSGLNQGELTANFASSSEAVARFLQSNKDFVY